MTAKEAAEQPEQTPLSDLREAALRHYEEVSSLAHHWNGAIPTAINFYYDALEAGATKEEQLQQRIKELEQQVEEANKQATAAWMYNRNANEKIRQMEEREGRFAEWASGQGWEYVKFKQMWAKVNGIDFTYKNWKTTAELWAEWDRSGSM